MKENPRWPNLSDVNGPLSEKLREALRGGNSSVASEILGEVVRKHKEKIQGPVPEKPQEVPTERKPENQKRHITRDGRR